MCIRDSPIILAPSLNKFLKGKKNRLFQDLTDFMRENNKRK